MSQGDITVLYYGEITVPNSAATPGLDPDLFIDGLFGNG